MISTLLGRIPVGYPHPSQASARFRCIRWREALQIVLDVLEAGGLKVVRRIDQRSHRHDLRAADLGSIMLRHRCERSYTSLTPTTSLTKPILLIRQHLIR